ncbi:MAG: ABC transporter substrate-binding protein [Treponema sp.]|nr:ABC transporter substrate-binding protein [Treponema sp.]
MKKHSFFKAAPALLFAAVAVLIPQVLHAKKAASLPYTFIDDLGRTVTVQNTDRVAVLQGSLAALWLLAGGSIDCATKDAFAEPPALTEEQAAALNEQWHTQAFRAHGAGVFSAAGIQQNAEKVPVVAGSMMAPNSELLLSRTPDFVILSANISAHKKLLPLLENAHIPAACFNYETFSQYLHILDVCTHLTGRSDLYDKHGTLVKAACDKQIALALSKRPKNAPTVLFLRAFSTGVQAKGSKDLASGDLLNALGTRNIADSGSFSTGDLSLEAIIAGDPDFIFVTTMGTNEKKALEAFQTKLATHPAWNGLTAVTNNHCIILPRELFHFKPLGEKWLTCYQILTGILYSE